MAEIKKESGLPKELSFHYIKSNDFRTTFITGLIGGVTVNSKLDLNFYTERAVIPNCQTHAVTNGQLGNIIPEKSSSKVGVVREVQVSLLMDFDTAKAVADWIYQNLETIKKTSE